MFSASAAHDIKNSKPDLSTSSAPAVEPDIEIKYSAPIAYNKLEFGRPLGSGGCAKVRFAALHLNSTQYTEVAVKKFKRKYDVFPEGSPDNHSVHLFQTENAILEKLASFSLQHIVKYYGYTERKKNCFAIVMEYLPGGDLSNFVSTKISPPKLYPMLIQVAEAIKELHHNHIVHGDLKPDNIMITGNGMLKLTDFGFTKILKLDETFSRSKKPEYTPGYAAPELLTDNIYSKATDIYAFGSTLYALAEGIPPFGYLPYETIGFYDKKSMKVYFLV